MNSALAVVGSVFLVVAALVHVGIFVLESVLWRRPSTWRRFGVHDQRDADALQPMAYNQGFYNLFLAVGAGIGLMLLSTAPSAEAGIAIAIFALASMLLAAIVLVASNPRMLRPALVQGAAPALALLFLVLSLVVG